MTLRWTPEQRERGIALAREHGPTHAARELGVPLPTVRSWLQRAKPTTGDASAAEGEQRARNLEAQHYAAERSRLTVEQKKANLAAALLDDLDRLRLQLFAPTVERKVVTLSGGIRGESRAEVVDTALTEPSFSDKRNLMTAIAIGVDKVQILTGAATERFDMMDADERRQRVARAVDQLAQRRRAKVAG